jgi:hypothetical protein
MLCRVSGTLVNNFPNPKGSRKNKLAILGVQAPGGQYAKANEYQAYFQLSQRRPAGCMGA